MLFLNIEFEVDEARFGRRHSELNTPPSAFQILTEAIRAMKAILAPLTLSRSLFTDRTKSVAVSFVHIGYAYRGSSPEVARKDSQT